MGKAARKARVITAREWRWAAGFAAAVMVATTLPYLVGAAAQTPEWEFGGFLIGVEDGNSYIAKMGQGARGAWRFTLPYTSEPQRGALIYLFYLGLGKLAGPDHGAQVIAFHVARIVFGFGLVLAAYAFLAEFLPRVGQRRLGLVLVALGGGLGWLLILLGQSRLLGSLPIDFYSPEAYSFLVLFTLPHLAAARCLFLLGLLAHLRGRAVLAGLALLGVGLIQPLYVVVAWVLLGIDFALGSLRPLRSSRFAVRSLREVLAPIVVSSPLVLYTTYLLVTDPFVRQWGAQGVVASPHPVHHLFGYGVLVLPAFLGWRCLARRLPALARFAGGWTLALPFLLYAPITHQRRLIEGFQLPLVALAVLGLTIALRRFRRWLVPLVLALSVPTTAVLLVGAVTAARRLAEPIFHPADQLAAFAWLADHVEPGQVVLSAFETGNALPAYTPLVAYIGHGPETVFLSAKAPRVDAFFQSATRDSERRALLADGRIAFVIFGPHERALGNFDPSMVDYMRLRFASGAYAVYAVAPR
jgi:hypothetical protein